MTPSRPALARLALPAVVSFATALGLAPAACSTPEPRRSTYFERTIAPVLDTSCARTNTGAGCHVADGRGNALGNLDVTSFENVDRRRDLLADYGPYGQPAFLAKVVEPFQVEVQTWDGRRVTVRTDIRHAGGSVLDPAASGYQTVRRWIQNGASENNTGDRPTPRARQRCSPFVPARAGFDPTRDPASPDFADFRDRVAPVLKETCAAGNCHGTAANSLVFACGDRPEEVRWNWFAATEYLGQTPELSELVRRPLAPSQGGAYHEGGVVFDSADDDGYRAIAAWAAKHGPAKTPEIDAGFDFFAHRVQPVLVKKGCMMLQCHSASAFHDYRLKGGSGGSFSLAATRRNHELSLLELAPESDDPAASRMVRKNLYRPELCAGSGCEGARGLVHRGGALFEDFGAEAARPELCEGKGYDHDAGDLDAIPAYCTMLEWLRRERGVFRTAPLSGVVYVRRPLGGVGRVQDFGAYAPGADLRLATLTTTPAGLVASADRSVLAGCGLEVATADVRRPAVSWDGSRVAFAARRSAAEPLRIFEMAADGTGCAPRADLAGAPASENGLLVHDLDPAYAPGGPDAPLVFASSRGHQAGDARDYAGPQRSPADPSRPNLDLFVSEPDPRAPGQRRTRQLTWLLNAEREPSFMADGRVVFTAEKRAPDFYQLAGRRLNLDGGDYHPLLAQRGSLAYPEATRIVELAHRDFAFVLREPGTPHGGGVLAVFNRSLGLDFTSTNPADYPVDPSVLDPASPSAVDPSFFLRALRIVDPGASARAGAATTGLYHAPAALPDGRVLVSFGVATDVASFDGDYDLWVVEPQTGARTKLLGEPGVAEVDAAPLYGRAFRGVFASALDEPNGHVVRRDDRREAEVHVLDARVLASLLFQNTPTGRAIDPDLRTFDLLEELPPPLEVQSFAQAGASAVTDAFGQVFVRRRLLGAVPIQDDGSAKFRIPGGVPFLFRLPDTPRSQAGALPRIQREAMAFAPGEDAHQGFRASSFDGLCGNCHGAISGRALDASVRPDAISSASETSSRDVAATDLVRPPAARPPVP